jgi:hypothetical protein
MEGERGSQVAEKIQIDVVDFCVVMWVESARSFLKKKSDKSYDTLERGAST